MNGMRNPVRTLTARTPPVPRTAKTTHELSFCVACVVEVTVFLGLRWGTLGYVWGYGCIYHAERCICMRGSETWGRPSPTGEAVRMSKNNDSLARAASPHPSVATAWATAIGDPQAAPSEGEGWKTASHKPSPSRGRCREATDEVENCRIKTLTSVIFGFL